MMQCSVVVGYGVIWWKHCLPKHRYQTSTLHGATIQKTTNSKILHFHLLKYCYNKECMYEALLRC